MIGEISMIDEKPAIEGGAPVRKEFLPVGRPLIGQEEKDEVIDTLNSDWISKGPKTKRFENDFKNYVGSKYAIAVSSCTAGLHIALTALGIKAGDEVITTPLTFVATGNAILYCGATPVLVDCKISDFNIDAALLEDKVTENTKSIIPVHFAGLPCDMEKIQKTAGKYNISVIEDAAHAIGAEYNGQKIGSIGDVSTFSFYATKNITTGDGGMITTDNEELAAKMEILSFFGISSDAWQRYSPAGKINYDMVELGYKYNMTDIQAAIGIHQLKKLDRFIETRKKYAEMLNKYLSEIPEIILQENKTNVRHGRHIYPIVLKTEVLKIDRKGFIDAMRAENIGCGIHFVALHKQYYYKKRFNFNDNDFPNASYISDRIVSLPLYPKMSENDIYDVVNAVKKIINHYRK